MSLRIRGTVSLRDGEFVVAGVTVVANMAAGMIPAPQLPQGVRVELGRAVTASDGSFVIETNDQDEQISRLACVLQNCGEFKFTLACFDGGETLLVESGPHSYNEESTIAILLPQPDIVPTEEDWAEFTSRMMDSQTAWLSDAAVELATLAPKATFKNLSVTKRLSLLRRLEQALLDPTNVFGNSGVALRFVELTDATRVRGLREQFLREERNDLLGALDASRDRAVSFASLRQADVLLHPEKLKVGDVINGVNDFLAVQLDPNLFPWLATPLGGYRDYLRDRWVEGQRFEPRLGGPPIELATAATIIKRLNQRFHQNFTTRDITEQPANRILIRILTTILVSPPGGGYGFNVAAAAIEPQGTRSDRDYLDFLISLTRLKVDELEKRYRLNLKRSDLEISSPVQQNIDTLQRFFTDSYQSVADPFAVKPDRKAGTAEALIFAFPDEGAGPFFLEYEEWLEREQPFYPENHFDPRATYQWITDEHPSQKTRDAVFSKSMPLAEAAELRHDIARFVPGNTPYDHAGAKWQWVRCHLELQDLIQAGHNDLKSLNYLGAEQKYGTALYLVRKLQGLISFSTKGFWDYDPAQVAKEQRNTDVSTLDKLNQYEGRYHLYLGWHYGLLQYGDINTDSTGKPTEITAKWWGDRQDIFPGPGYRGTVAYLLDHLSFRLLPACLSEAQLAQGKYGEAVRQLIEPAGFNIFAAPPDLNLFEGLAVAGSMRHPTDGPLPYASYSDRTIIPAKSPVTKVPTNRAELGYFKLKLGNATLEWADVLYRSNQPESIMRARELYKAVLFLHDEDPEITPTWDPLQRPMPPLFGKSHRNPAIVSQVSRARLGFTQINAGLNYYGISPKIVPPVRFRVLQEAANRFAAGARGAQTDFLNYMQQLDQITVSEMTARTMVAKASAAISIAQEQQKIAEFHVGEVQRQVDSIAAQIEAKRKQIAKSTSFFEQFTDFVGGMFSSISALAKSATRAADNPEAASATNISDEQVLGLAWKFGSSGGDMAAASGALGSSMAVAGPFALFIYAGVSSITGMAAAANKPILELKALENALPAAKALVELKKRDVTIAQLTQTIAKADWQLGKDLLAFYSSRFLNRSFLINLSEFSNRLMRRYLDLAGHMAWSAERALAFEQDRDLGIIGFDYFPRNLRGVTGADLLQLHLSELEAARIQGLTQTIPVKQTFSLARDFPIQMGQLKKNGQCTFATSETPLRLVYPGVYGYRVRNVTVAAAYSEPVQAHRGLFSNQGVSLVSRSQVGDSHIMVRYPDALPLSEFRMRNDMWVFDLPDETLLPFEGSGIETVWELTLSKIGNATSFETLADVLITFDMRASYSAFLEKQHLAALPNSANRSLMVSAKKTNPGALAKFRKDGGQLKLSFDLKGLAKNPNETTRNTLNFVIGVIGVGDAAVAATFSSDNPVQSEAITFEKGAAFSNAGVLADGNGGVPLPLNTFVGLDVDQIFSLTIDADANAGIDFKDLSEVLMLVEYDATF